MNFLEAFFSDARTTRSMRGSEDLGGSVPGVGNCDPKPEYLFWHNEIWHCQRELQNVSLSHFDKEEEFRAKAIG
jgi:hypothetical protein